eukprot:TRINITY_DN40786_c0_g1_i1.p1 TRINITY_DN40786_c0_g1~~TRINITY_DN40786_c0_g1_i1.p1  ORF type:complete len:1296 (+),score=170.49 TRINITY_DN40786_c0_g1_i1:396-3890(+)
MANRKLAALAALVAGGNSTVNASRNGRVSVGSGENVHYHEIIRPYTTWQPPLPPLPNKTTAPPADAGATCTSKSASAFVASGGEELAEAHRLAFRQLDTDGSGAITTSELRAAMLLRVRSAGAIGYSDEESPSQFDVSNETVAYLIARAVQSAASLAAGAASLAAASGDALGGADVVPTLDGPEALGRLLAMWVANGAELAVPAAEAKAAGAPVRWSKPVSDCICTESDILDSLPPTPLAGLRGKFGAMVISAHRLPDASDFVSCQRLCEDDAAACAGVTWYGPSADIAWASKCYLSKVSCTLGHSQWGAQSFRLHRPLSCRAGVRGTVWCHLVVTAAAASGRSAVTVVVPKAPWEAGGGADVSGRGSLSASLQLSSALSTSPSSSASSASSSPAALSAAAEASPPHTTQEKPIAAEIVESVCGSPPADLVLLSRACRSEVAVGVATAERASPEVRPELRLLFIGESPCEMSADFRNELFRGLECPFGFDCRLMVDCRGARGFESADDIVALNAKHGVKREVNDGRTPGRILDMYLSVRYVVQQACTSDRPPHIIVFHVGLGDTIFNGFLDPEVVDMIRSVVFEGSCAWSVVFAAPNIAQAFVYHPEGRVASDAGPIVERASMIRELLREATARQFVATVGGCPSFEYLDLDPSLWVPTDYVKDYPHWCVLDDWGPYHAGQVIEKMKWSFFLSFLLIFVGCQCLLYLLGSCAGRGLSQQEPSRDVSRSDGDVNLCVHLKALDGIRIVAAIHVASFHIFEAGDGFFFILLGWGRLWVQFFFVLSGFFAGHGHTSTSIGLQQSSAAKGGANCSPEGVDVSPQLPTSLRGKVDVLTEHLRLLCALLRRRLRVLYPLYITGALLDPRSVGLLLGSAEGKLRLAAYVGMVQTWYPELATDPPNGPSWFVSCLFTFWLFQLAWVSLLVRLSSCALAGVIISCWVFAAVPQVAGTLAGMDFNPGAWYGLPIQHLWSFSPLTNWHLFVAGSCAGVLANRDIVRCRGVVPAFFGLAACGGAAAGLLLDTTSWWRYTQLLERGFWTLPCWVWLVLRLADPLSCGAVLLSPLAPLARFAYPIYILHVSLARLLETATGQLLTDPTDVFFKVIKLFAVVSGACLIQILGDMMQRFCDGTQGAALYERLAGSDTAFTTGVVGSRSAVGPSESSFLNA